MTRVTKVIIGILVALIALIGVVIVTHKPTQYIAPEDLESNNASSEVISQVKDKPANKPKGTITVEDTVHDAKLAAAVMGLYGGWKLDDKGWEMVGSSLGARDEIDIFYSSDSKGQTKYQFVRIGEKESDHTPWYRLAGKDLRTVVYFSGNDKKLATLKLADMIDYVNEHYSNDEIYTIKVGIYVQPSGSTPKAKKKDRPVTSKNTPKTVQKRAKEVETARSTTTAPERVDLNADFDKNINLWAREIMTYVENNLDEIDEYSEKSVHQGKIDISVIVNLKLGQRDDYNRYFDLSDYPRSYSADLNNGRLGFVVPQSGIAFALETNANYLTITSVTAGGTVKMAEVPLDLVEDYLTNYSGDLVQVQIK